MLRFGRNKILMVISANAGILLKNFFSAKSQHLLRLPLIFFFGRISAFAGILLKIFFKQNLSKTLRLPLIFFQSKIPSKQNSNANPMRIQSEFKCKSQE